MADAQNVQIVEQLYSSFGRGDLPAILGLLDENVEWHFVGQPEDVPFAGQHHGKQQVAEFFMSVGQATDVLEFGPSEIMGFDDKVLVLGHERVHVRATDRVFATDWIHLFTIQDDKIVRLREFYDTATMASAFRAD